jgi:hypothetical protein
MRVVRFPQKVKVQEPCHKAYVLLLCAVDKTEISDFSLRVEQSEIVEQCVRILSALFDNALERQKGLLLESCILFRRSLVLQMWEDIGSNRSIFELCPRLPAAMIPRFIDCSLNSVEDFASHRPRELQGILRCSLTDLKNIQSFTKMIQHSKLSVHLVNVQDALLHLRIQTSVDQTSQENNDPNEKNFQSRVFHLICFDLDSSLVCYRRIHSIDHELEYRIAVTHPISADSIWISLTCEDMIGLDYKISPVSFSTPQPETRLRRIGEFALTAARNLDRDFPSLSPEKRDDESRINKKQKTCKQSTLKSPFFRNVPSQPKKKTSTKSADQLSGFGIFEAEEQNHAPAAGRFSRFALSSPTPSTQVSSPLSFPRGQVQTPTLSQSTEKSHLDGFESHEMKLLKSKGREFQQSYSPIKSIRSRVIHPPARATTSAAPVITVQKDSLGGMVTLGHIDRLNSKCSPFPVDTGRLANHGSPGIPVAGQERSPLIAPRHGLAEGHPAPPPAVTKHSFRQSSQQSDLFDRGFL